MKKFVCSVCGYVQEGNEPPEKCPQCGAPKEKFVEQKAQSGELAWADEHRIGVAKDVDKEILEGLRANFTGECTELRLPGRRNDRQTGYNHRRRTKTQPDNIQINECKSEENV